LLSAPIAAVAFAVIVFFGSFVVAADDDEKKPIPIKPPDARKHVGKKVIVEFDVKKTKHSPKRKKYYIDSEEDFQDERNIGIQIDEPMALKLREEKKVEDVAKFYEGKKIRVAGVIVLEDDRPYIKLAAPDDIDVVEKKKSEKQ
jgi:hypothetical protein